MLYFLSNHGTSLFEFVDSQKNTHTHTHTHSHVCGTGIEVIPPGQFQKGTIDSIVNARSAQRSKEIARNACMKRMKMKVTKAMK